MPREPLLEVAKIQPTPKCGEGQPRTEKYNFDDHGQLSPEPYSFPAVTLPWATPRP